MEVRRIADSLLRSRPTPILSFLVPSISSKRSSTIALPCSFYASSAIIHTGIRHITTQPPRLQPSSAPAVAEPEDDAPPQQTLTSPSTSTKTSASTSHSDITESPPPPSKLQQIGDILDSTMAGHSYTSTRSSKFKSSSAQTAQAPTLSSSSQLASEFNLAMSRTNPYRDHQGLVFSAMDKPASPTEHAASSLGRAEAIRRDITPVNPRNVRTIRLSPSLGRVVDIDPTSGVDLARGLRLLDIKCAVNKVRRDVAEQRFHERAGLKRKRLKSERWRRKFRDGFQAVVSKVQDMRKRGW